MQEFDVYLWLVRNAKDIKAEELTSICKAMIETGADTPEEAFSSISKPSSQLHSYTIMNKDTPIITFQLRDVTNNIYEVVGDKKVDYPKMTIKEFVGLRKPCKNRKFLQELLESMQIFTTSGYLDVALGLSLNDTLWIRPTNSSLQWSDVNLYDNEFNEVVSHFAFNGVGLKGMHMATVSPEFTTNGMLPKCWKRVNGTIYLYKGGTTGASNTGNEPYSEYFASQILDAMGMDGYTTYKLDVYHDTLVSTCELFTSKEAGYAPICNLYNPSDFLDIVKLYDQHNLRAELNDLMVFDVLICNEDRHLNNYGFLIDNDSYDIEGRSPIFDNGNGIIPYYTLDKDLDSYIAEHDFQNCGIPNKDVLSICLTPRQRAMVKKLCTFELTQHPIYKIPDERLKVLNEFIHKRVSWILSQ